MPGPYRVGVVGLGVAGATTAYLLARDGHHVTVLEQSERVGPAGDGARSRLREACGFKASVTRYSHGTLWVIAPGRFKGHLLQVVRGTRKLFGLLPLGDGLVTMYWGLPVREFDGLKARGLDSLKDEILRFSPEAGEVLDFLHDFEQLILTT